MLSTSAAMATRSSCLGGAASPRQRATGDPRIATRGPLHTTSNPLSAPVRSTRLIVPGLGLPRQPISISRFPSAVQAAGTSDTVAAGNALTEWLQGSAGTDTSKFPVQFGSSADGLSLTATRDIKKGEVVFEVPERAWLTPSTAQQSPIGPYIKDMEPWMQLVLFIMLQKGGLAPEGSVPYSATLPASYSNSPLFWEDEQLSLLEGSQCLANTLGYKEFLLQRYAELEVGLFSPNRSIFPESAFSQNTFFWAFSWLRARVHPPLERENIALVPFADLVEHSSSSAATWKVRNSGLFGANGKAVVLEADRPYQAGDKVCMNFALDGLASQLALDYGVSGTKAAGFSLTLSIPGDDRFVDDKVDIAEINGYAESWTWTLRPQSRVPEDLLAYLRLLNCSGEDAFHLEALFREVAWQHFLDPISPENESAVCQSIVDGCMEALNQYSSSIDEDIALLRDGNLGEREKMAVEVRLGEKQTLDAYLLYFASRRDKLDDLEYYAESRLKSLGLLDDSGEPPSFESMLDSGIA